MVVRQWVALLLVAELALAGCESSGGSGSSSSSATPDPAAATAAKVKKEDARADVDRVAADGLQRLYKTQPKAEKAVMNSAGYAVFSNFGLQVFLLGGAGGEGVAVDNKTGHRVYMKMVQASAGFGLAVQKYQMVWVFETRDKLNQFINSGWELGASGTAAAKASDQGAALEGALSIAPGVWLYQLTDSGLALELTAKGTKFYKDKDLN